MGRNIAIYSGYDDSDYLAHHGVKGMKWGVRKSEYKRARNNASQAQRKAARKYARQDFWTLRPKRAFNRLKRIYTDKDTKRLAIGGAAASVGSTALDYAARRALTNGKGKKAAALAIGSLATGAAGLGMGATANKRLNQKLRYEHLTGKADKRYEIDPRTMKKKYSR